MVLFTTKHTALKNGCSAEGLEVTERHLWLNSQILGRRSSCWTLLFHSWCFSTMLWMLILTSETGWLTPGNTGICWLVQQHIRTPAEANASWPAGPEDCSWSNGMETEGQKHICLYPSCPLDCVLSVPLDLYQGPAANGQRGTNTPPKKYPCTSTPRT